MNELSRGIVIVSTLLAAIVEIDQAAYAFTPIWYVSVAGFALAFALGSRLQSIIARTVLVSIYLSPALVLLWSGIDHSSFQMAWMGPLLGLVLSGRGASRWSLPSLLFWPLVAWVLIVSVSGPIVMLRETDFAPWILALPRVSNTSVGVSPSESIGWVAYTILTTNVGVLWFDWLFRCYRGRQVAFVRDIIAPLAIGVTIACVVAAYQGFVDLDFMNGHVWPHMRRASGTLMDANAFGMIAALWSAALVALTLHLPRPLATPAAILGVALTFVGVYTSGSRTALIVIAIGLLAVLAHGWSVLRADRSQPFLRRWWPAAATLAIFAIFVVLIALGSTTTSIVARGIKGFVPVIGDLGPGEVWRQLTDRFGYGRTAWMMIGEHPWSGVGTGGFLTLVHDYSTQLPLAPDNPIRMNLAPDNAQNWFRHQLVELGVLGSLGGFLWCLLCGRALLSTPRDALSASTRLLLSGSLIAIGIASMLGVPGQSAAVTITFWTFAFWLMSSVAWTDSVSSEHPGTSRFAWALIGVLVIVHGAGTYAAARGDLRPAARAQRFGWFYRYGLHDLEPGTKGNRGRWWTMKDSVAVIPVQGRVLKFVCWIDHPDTNPVRVRVSADGRVVLDKDMHRGESAAFDITASTGEQRMLIETSVSRTFRPSDHGVPDTRELGLAMADWLWEP